MPTTAKPKKKPIATSLQVYQLRVSLDHSDPEIWRRLWVPGTLTLAKLSLVVQITMGWTNSHLHAFEIGGVRYGMGDNDWQVDDDDEAELDERRHKLAKVVAAGVKRFRYIYDFGDDWRHTIVVEKRFPANDLNRLPLCVDGQNACPPEDVGGMGGYYAFLEAVGNPSHAEHHDMWLWGGGPFDPAGFNRNSVNAMLRSATARIDRSLVQRRVGLTHLSS